jgi:hypothetical protein
MRKINDTQLLEMIDAGTPRKEIAKYFGCSEAALSKRMARLRPVHREPIKPLKIDSLTKKEKAFVVAIARGETQTNAALKSHDVTSRTSAKSLGCTLMKRPGIKEALAEIREREIPLSHLVGKLRQHVDSVDPSTSLKAVDMGLKLHDAYPASKNVNLNVDVPHHIDLSAYKIG